MEKYSQGTPLILTKLQPPKLASDFVDRPHLLEKLNSGLDKKLTLVSAPAGYGKTTLIASWMQTIPNKSVWISLEESENDLLSFLRYLSEAVRILFPESCEETIKLAQSDFPPPPEYLSAVFINDILAIGDSFIMAADDFHYIHSASIRKFLTALITNQPANLHIVVLTRRDPLLPLSHLRAAGQLLEIRTPDLRFEDDLARLFLEKSSGLPIDHNTATAVNGLTEGWISGLRLLVLAVSNLEDLENILIDKQRQPVSLISEYLFFEVLERLSQSLKAFIIHISILDRLSAPLCDAVTKEKSNGDSQALLKLLEGENLFLIPLDSRGEWYRLHHLFQTLLLKELKSNYTNAEIAQLHRRASMWFAKEGFTEEALHHALAAHDVELAAGHVESQSQNLLNSLDRHTLDRWMSMLPEEIIWRRSRLIMAKAWLYFREWRFSPMDEALSTAKTILKTEALDEELKLAVDGHIACLQAVSLRLSSRKIERSHKLTQTALASLPFSAQGARSLSYGILGLAEQALGNFDVAVTTLERIIHSPAYQGPFKIQAFLGLGYVYLSAAELVPFKQIVEQFLILASQTKNPNAISSANMLAGRFAYETNELEQAAKHFAQVLEVRYRANFLTTFEASMGLARIYLAADQLAQAQSEIDLLRHETLHLHNSDLMPHLESFQAYLWMRQEESARPLRWARSFNPNSVNEFMVISEFAGLTRVQILIEIGSEEEVLEVIQYLNHKLDAAQSTYFTYMMIQIRIRLALAYQRLSDFDRALSELEWAVLLAQPGGFIRLFVDMGSAILALLNALNDKGIALDYTTEILAKFPISVSTRRSPKKSNYKKRLLTPRQTEILLLLQQGYSYQEISATLSISLNTVKKHVSNIYENLEASNRQEAIYIAREMDLIT